MRRFAALFVLVPGLAFASPKDTRPAKLAAWVKAGLVLDVKEDAGVQRAQIMVSPAFTLLPEKKQTEIAGLVCGLAYDTVESVEDCEVLKADLPLGTIDIAEGGPVVTWADWYLAELRRRAFARRPEPKS